MQWDPRTCSCKCNIQCNARQTIDKQNCMCLCKQKHFETCMRVNKVIDASTCFCVPPAKKSTGNTGMRTSTFFCRYILPVALFRWLLYWSLFLTCLQQKGLVIVIRAHQLLPWAPEARSLQRKEGKKERRKEEFSPSIFFFLFSFLLFFYEGSGT